MLKWTKVYPTEDEVITNDKIKIDKHSDKYSEVKLTDNLLLCEQTTIPQKGQLFTSLDNWSQSHTILQGVSPSPLPSEQLYQTNNLSLAVRFAPQTSSLPQSSLPTQNSPTLATVNSETAEAVPFKTSYPQIISELADGAMSALSTLSSDTVPTSTSRISPSAQPQSSTESTAASDTEINRTYQTEMSTTSHLTPPAQQKYPHTITSTLPDIARSVPTTEREILGPTIAWEQEHLTIEQMANIDTFPCVCLFEENVQERHKQKEVLGAGLKIYSRQPVLMYMRTQKRQARVRTIFKDPRGAYYEVGQTMIIPDDYQGWFEVVPSDFRRTACFMSIGDVVKAMPRKFFTRSNIKGIRIEGEGELQKYLERKVQAGSVLETRGTFTAKWKTRAETGMFKKKTMEWELQEVTYLKCLDSDQQEILIPVTHKGKFNSIYERGKLTQNAVYSMKDILSDLSLPVKVRLLFGKAPVVPCIFTGMLVVRSTAVGEAVVGSTILNKRNVLFEISVNAPVKVKYISKDEPIAEMATYKDAQRLCKKYANLFSTMIKLSSDLDTDQKVIMHVPSDPSFMRKVDETLHALDLITDISFTDKPKDYLLDSSDSASLNSEDQVVMPKGGTLEMLEEFKGRESHTHV